MNALEVMTSHKTDKWNTPKEVVADVIRFFGKKFTKGINKDTTS